MAKNVTEVVSRYMTAPRRRSFQKLYQVVESACLDAKKHLGPEIVTRVYGRAEKQGDDLLKTDVKIAAKIVK